MKKKLILIPILSLALLLSMAVPVFAYSPPSPSNDIDVEVTVTEITLAGVPEVGEEVTVSGTVTVTSSAESDYIWGWDSAYAESGAGFQVLDPDDVEIDSDWEWIEDYDAETMWDWSGAEAEAGQIYIWSSTFTLDKAGDYKVLHGGHAYAWFYCDVYWGEDYSDEDGADDGIMLLFSVAAPSEKDPNRFSVIMPYGWGRSSYINERDNILESSLGVVGLYQGVGYKLDIPEGCEITRLGGSRLHQLYLKDISGETLTFTCDDILFSEPCVLFMATSVYYNEWGRLITDGEWVEIGSFTEIVDGTATLE